MRMANRYLLFKRDRDEVRIDAVRQVSFQAHHHCLVGAVAATGEGQRTVDLGPDPRGARQVASLVQPFLHEARGGTHRADGVRGTRPDADLEQVECADGHGPYSMPPCPS